MRRSIGVILLAILFAIHSTVSVTFALPQGGLIVHGDASIEYNSNSLTVDQSSEKLIIDWTSFDIDAGERVRFEQANESYLALNRVTGTNPTLIDGLLEARGHVFVVNPHGVLFGRGAQVDVGGLIASALSLHNDDFLAGRYTFTDGEGSGVVINQGSIHASPGGSISLLGNQVVNEGELRAPGGRINLASGEVVTLSLDNRGRLAAQVDAATLGALVENRGLISADGGEVLLTAAGRDALLETVVNNEGVIEARTLQDEGGVIKLLGGMKDDAISVGGVLDASAPDGGDGGFIETSAARVSIEDGAVITTRAADGRDGAWLIDPTDFYIAASDPSDGAQSFMSVATLEAALANTNVTIETVDDDHGTDPGDIFVLSPVTWHTDNTLTLRAHNDIWVLDALTSTGGGNVVLRADKDGTGGGTVNFRPKGSVNTAGEISIYYNPTSYTDPTDFGAHVAGGGTLTAYMLINDLTDLANVKSNLSGAYALGRDIDGTGSGVFHPIGGETAPFKGIFDGLDHTISGLHIAGENFVGLFGQIGGDGVVRNFRLEGSTIRSSAHAGAIAGQNHGRIENVSASAEVKGESNIIGGLVGRNTGIVTRSWADGTVQGIGPVGGLVGLNEGRVEQTYATGSVHAISTGGGLVGENSGSIEQSYFTGSVTGPEVFSAISAIGGLVGVDKSGGSIVHSFSTGSVTPNGIMYVGGLVGWNEAEATVDSSWVSGRIRLADVPEWDEPKKLGAYVGYNEGSVNGGHYDSDTVGVANPCQGPVPCGSTSNAQTDTGDSTKPDSYGHLGTWSRCETGWCTDDSVWFMLDGRTRPMLAWEWSTTITNLHQLQLMAMDPAASYVLANDLDFGTIFTDDDRSDIWVASEDSQTAFAPIGESFTGSFDGQGHAISNLKVKDPVDSNGVALFRKTGAGTVIKNLKLVGGSVTGTQYIGALVGQNYGTIENVHSSMDVRGETTIAESLTGGLVGGNFGSVIRSSASGTVNAGGWAGGLVGYNDSGAEIVQTYAVGAVTGTGEGLGGLVGRNAGRIVQSYARGAVTGENVVGGLVGANLGSVEQSYATGSVASNGEDHGGLVGSILHSGSVSNSFYDADSTGQTDTGKGIPLTTDEMKDPFEFIDEGWDFDSVWSQSSIGENDGYMMFRWQEGTLYDGFVRVNNVSRTYGSDNPSIESFVQAIGEVGVDASWGSAITATTTVGEYHLADPNVMNISITSPNDRYYFAPATSKLTITRAPLIITAKSLEKTYGDTLVFAGTEFTATGLMNGETIGTVSLSSAGSAATAAAGTYPIEVSDATGGTFDISNYDVSYQPGTLTVGKATLTVTPTPGQAKVYGDPDPVFTYSVTGFKNNEDKSVIGGQLGRADGKGVGTYSYTLGTLNAENYRFVLAGGIDGFTINRAPLTITAKSLGKTYGDTLVFAGTEFTAEGLKYGETIGSVSLSSAGSAATAAAGTYPIEVFDATGGTFDISNYDVSYQPGTLTVGKATLTVTPTPGQAKVYGDPDSVFTYSVTGFKNNEDESVIGGQLGRADGKDVGTYSYTLGTLDAENYRFVLAGGIDGFTINRAPLTITAKSLGKTYGDTLVFAGTEFTAEGLKYGETIGSVSLSSAGSAATAAAVTYPIAVSDATGGNFDINNYDVQYVSGTLTVHKAPLTVTADNKWATYDGAVYDGGFTVSYDGFVAGEDASVLGGTLVYGGDSQTAKNAGTYTITASGLTSSNYEITFVDGTLIIDPVSLTVTAENKWATYDGAVYDGGFTVSYHGFVGGEDERVLGGTLVFGGDSQTAKDAGTYTITASGLTSNNYEITFVDGTLRIDPAPLTVTADNKRATYDGAVYDGGFTVSYHGFVAGEDASVLGGTLVFGGDSQTAKDAGTYTITASGLMSDNYTIRYVDGTLRIDPAPLTVTADNKWATYDGAVYDGGFTVSYDGFVGGEDESVLGGTLAFGGDSQTAKDAGTYTITASGLMSDNYTIRYVDGTLRINRAPITWITGIVAHNKVYDGTTQVTLDTSGAKFIGLVGGDKLTVASATGAFAEKDAGESIAVIITGLTLGGADAHNYELVTDQVTTTADIEPRVVHLSGSRVYNASEFVAADVFELANLVDGEQLRLVGEGRMDDKHVGTAKDVHLHTLELRDGPNGKASNYTLIGGTHVVDITRAPIHSIGGIVARDKTYDGSTDAQLDLSAAVFNGRFEDDVLTVGSARGKFSDPSAGTQKTVSITELSLDGPDARNYTLIDATGVAFANIHRAKLVIVGSSVSAKDYDGTRIAQVNVGTAVGVVGSDDVVVSASGLFDNKNAGTGKDVYVSYALSGDDAGNYTVDGEVLTGAIHPIPLRIVGIAAKDKLFDGLTAAEIIDFGVLVGVLEGDAVILDVSEARGEFVDANPGQGKTVLVTGLKLAGDDALNYRIADVYETIADIVAGDPPTPVDAPTTPQIPGEPYPGAGTQPTDTDVGTEPADTDVGSEPADSDVDTEPVDTDTGRQPTNDDPSESQPEFVASEIDLDGLELTPILLTSSCAAGVEIAIGITPDGVLVVTVPEDAEVECAEEELIAIALAFAQENLGVDLLVRELGRTSSALGAC